MENLKLMEQTVSKIEIEIEAQLQLILKIQAKPIEITNHDHCQDQLIFLSQQNKKLSQTIESNKSCLIKVKVFAQNQIKDFAIIQKKNETQIHNHRTILQEMEEISVYLQKELKTVAEFNRNYFQGSTIVTEFDNTVQSFKMLIGHLFKAKKCDRNSNYVQCKNTLEANKSVNLENEFDKLIGSILIAFYENFGNFQTSYRQLNETITRIEIKLASLKFKNRKINPEIIQHQNIEYFTEVENSEENLNQFEKQNMLKKMERNKKLIKEIYAKLKIEQEKQRKTRNLLQKFSQNVVLMSLEKMKTIETLSIVFETTIFTKLGVILDKLNGSYPSIKKDKLRMKEKMSLKLPNWWNFGQSYKNTLQKIKKTIHQIKSSKNEEIRELLFQYRGLLEQLKLKKKKLKIDKIKIGFNSQSPNPQLNSKSNLFGSQLEKTFSPYRKNHLPKLTFLNDFMVQKKPTMFQKFTTNPILQIPFTQTGFQIFSFQILTNKKLNYLPRFISFSQPANPIGEQLNTSVVKEGFLLEKESITTSPTISNSPFYPFHSTKNLGKQNSEIVHKELKKLYLFLKLRVENKKAGIENSKDNKVNPETVLYSCASFSDDSEQIKGENELIDNCTIYNPETMLHNINNLVRDLLENSNQINTEKMGKFDKMQTDKQIQFNLMTQKNVEIEHQLKCKIQILKSLLSKINFVTIIFSNIEDRITNNFLFSVETKIQRLNKKKEKLKSMICFPFYFGNNNNKQNTLKKRNNKLKISDSLILNYKKQEIKSLKKLNLSLQNLNYESIKFETLDDNPNRNYKKIENYRKKEKCFPVSANKDLIIINKKLSNFDNLLFENIKPNENLIKEENKLIKEIISRKLFHNFHLNFNLVERNRFSLGKKERLPNIINEEQSTAVKFNYNFCIINYHKKSNKETDNINLFETFKFENDQNYLQQNFQSNEFKEILHHNHEQIKKQFLYVSIKGSQNSIEKSEQKPDSIIQLENVFSFNSHISTSYQMLEEENLKLKFIIAEKKKDGQELKSKINRKIKMRIEKLKYLIQIHFEYFEEVLGAIKSIKLKELNKVIESKKRVKIIENIQNKNQDFNNPIFTGKFQEIKFNNYYNKEKIIKSRKLHNYISFIKNKVGLFQNISNSNNSISKSNLRNLVSNLAYIQKKEECSKIVNGQFRAPTAIVYQLSNAIETLTRFHPNHQRELEDKLDNFKKSAKSFEMAHFAVFDEEEGKLKINLEMAPQNQTENFGLLSSYTPFQKENLLGGSFHNFQFNSNDLISVRAKKSFNNKMAIKIRSLISQMDSFSHIIKKELKTENLIKIKNKLETVSFKRINASEVSIKEIEEKIKVRQFLCSENEFIDHVSFYDSSIDFSNEIKICGNESKNHLKKSGIEKWVSLDNKMINSVKDFNFKSKNDSKENKTVLSRFVFCQIGPIFVLKKIKLNVLMHTESFINFTFKNNQKKSREKIENKLSSPMKTYHNLNIMSAIEQKNTQILNNCYQFSQKVQTENCESKSFKKSFQLDKNYQRIILQAKKLNDFLIFSVQVLNYRKPDLDDPKDQLISELEKGLIEMEKYYERFIKAEKHKTINLTKQIDCRIQNFITLIQQKITDFEKRLGFHVGKCCEIKNHVDMKYPLKKTQNSDTNKLSL